MLDSQNGTPPSIFGTGLFGQPLQGEQARGPLHDRFVIPPFTVLNAREGVWQERKRAWLALGIESEVGRGENLLKMSDQMLDPSIYKEKNAKANDQVVPAGLCFGEMTMFDRNSKGRAMTGTSIFDPVLCELAYRWFCPPGGVILDPFAGGSVRGIVASKLGRKYFGVDLRPEQIRANMKQGRDICGEDRCPRWIGGDSLEVMNWPETPEADFIFSCPPYADLERYSDDPRDLSTMEYHTFVATYKLIILRALRKLKNNRFACFVVGDVRDQKTGIYRNFVQDTINAFTGPGLGYYNQAILINSVGTLAMRVTKQFRPTRKMGMSHQYLLGFVKGDPRKAAEACGAIDADDAPDDGGEDDGEGELAA
jgi:DNA modification methylase